MPVENSVDRAVFFDSDDFGVVAVINSTNISGIFDNGYSEFLDVAGTTPTFTCESSDLTAITPTISRGTTAIISGTNYTIENIKNDNTGVTILELTEA